MLRFMFGEPKREAGGKLLEAYRLMERFASLAGERADNGQDKDLALRKYEIWTQGLIVSLDELEQSHYAALRFKERIRSASVSEMSEQELDDYHRYLYFDKNGFIRLFAILDKLGTLLNDMLELHTERIKPHFSYFTVLRNMRDRNVHPELTKLLDEVKIRTKDATNRLRKRRNTEIHYMNAEMVDDLAFRRRLPEEEPKLENISAQAYDLSVGMELVVDSLIICFRFACDWLRTRQ
ncbi:Cthe_2314 family HEPN domain-containing protein [Paenibacillus thailandensis]|uniref:Cthe_2314 family HEPN domain-containing protein n=1 Tax=Paenibacillus thailandensis TaxID=393250 RepID=A0ABW5QSD1_9BACL